MSYFDGNKLESIFVASLIKQWWSGTSALSSNENHKNEFKSILLNKLQFERPQLLIIREGGHWDL